MTANAEGLTNPEWLAGLVMVVVDAWWREKHEPIPASTISSQVAATVGATFDETWRPVDRAIQRNRRAGLIQFTAGRKGGWSPVAP